MVLIIILVPTVNADEYTAKEDIIIDTKYYEFYKAQFGEDKNYKFFAYNCYYGSYTRTCYYGIDNDYNYVKIDYVSSGTSYVTNISKGTDTSFNVSGVNIIEVKPSATYQLTYGLAFCLVLYVASLLLAGLLKGRE